MKTRCSNVKSDRYPFYGGRGIRVCERWADYDAFIADVGRKPSPLHTLERINNDGHYEPGNIRWATKKEQARNRRSTRVVAGVSLTEAAERHGISASTLAMRLRRGMDEHSALTEPLRRWE